MIEITELGCVYESQLRRARLKNDVLDVSILNVGAITQSIIFKGVNALLGYSDSTKYLSDPYHMGAIAGRVANRIGNGNFTLDRVQYQLAQNNGPHHLHGGPNGFGKRIWGMDVDGGVLVLSLHSPSGEEGYPNDVHTQLRLSLDGPNLVYEISATASGPTPINLAQHNYYNLGGAISDHALMIDGTGYCMVDDDQLPTGEITEMAGAFDFKTLRKIGSETVYDHNFCLVDGFHHAARVIGSNMGLDMFTDQVGIQLYTGVGLAAPFEKFGGLCLEPQYYPDAINHPEWVSPIHGPNDPYSQKSVLRFFDV
jgi:aldose 1-epimerase